MSRPNRMGKTRVATAALLAAVLLLGACSGSDDAANVATSVAYATEETMAASGGEAMDAELVGEPGVKVSPAIGTELPDGLKVIRDGRVDIRVEVGTFGQISSKLRSIAADLGG